MAWTKAMENINENNLTKCLIIPSTKGWKHEGQV